MHVYWVLSMFENLILTGSQNGGRGKKKIVLKVSNLKELEQIKQDAIEIGVPWSEVTDAGHTQIAPGTVTCISLGPAPEEKIDKITGDLKLM